MQIGGEFTIYAVDDVTVSMIGDTGIRIDMEKSEFRGLAEDQNAQLVKE